MLSARPPYALAPASFRFPALATLAGRSPIGGQREVALAVYVTARLAHDLLPQLELPKEVRQERAAGARNWLATLTLATPIRVPLGRLIEASVLNRHAAAEALRAVITVTAPFLDTRARAELDQLAGALEAA